MLTPRRPTARTLAGTVLLLFVFAYVLYPRRPASSHASQQATSDPIVAGATAANTTLGFGAIAVISRGPGSTRYHALMQAANVTELDLVVPEQPVWTADDLAEYQEQDGTDGAVQKSEGSALAWLGHINALKW